MVHDPQHLERLMQELADLEPEERAYVAAGAARRGPSHARKILLAPPTLSGGTAWIGGDLRREELYGDDGR